MLASPAPLFATCPSDGVCSRVAEPGRRRRSAGLDEPVTSIGREAPPGRPMYLQILREASRRRTRDDPKRS